MHELLWSQPGSNGGIVECIVSCDLFPSCTTNHAVISKDVAVPATGQAGACDVIHWHAQPRFGCNDKFWAADVKVECWKRGTVAAWGRERDVMFMESVRHPLPGFSEREASGSAGTPPL